MCNVLLYFREVVITGPVNAQVEVRSDFYLETRLFATIKSATLERVTSCFYCPKFFQVKENLSTRPNVQISSYAARKNLKLLRAVQNVGLRRKKKKLNSCALLIVVTPLCCALKKKNHCCAGLIIEPRRFRSRTKRLEGSNAF